MSKKWKEIKKTVPDHVNHFVNRSISLGNRIQSAMKEQNASFEELSESTGISKQTLKNYTIFFNPSLKNLTRIELALNIKLINNE